MTPPFSAQTRLLVVAPHPDDETLATGVLVQQVLAAGGAVHLLLLTDGDNNPWPQRWLERRVRVGQAERRRWAERRRSELHRAMAALGLPASALTALGWADQGLTARVQGELTASMARLGDVVRVFGPTLVAMPALDDRHPDHASAHVLMRLAMAACDVHPDCLLYRVHGSSGRARLAVNWPAEPGMLARKLAALACHASQLALSHARMHRLAARVECFEWLRPAEARTALPWHPARVSRPWLTLTLASVGGGSVSTWSGAPWRRDEAGRSCLQLPTAAAGSPRFVKLQSMLPTPWIFDHWGWCELTG